MIRYLPLYRTRSHGPVKPSSLWSVSTFCQLSSSATLTNKAWTLSSCEKSLMLNAGSDLVSVESGSFQYSEKHSVWIRGCILSWIILLFLKRRMTIFVCTTIDPTVDRSEFWTRKCETNAWKFSLFTTNRDNRRRLLLSNSFLRRKHLEHECITFQMMYHP